MGQGRLFEGLTQPPTRVKIHLWNVHRHSGPGRYFKDLKYIGRYSAFLHVSGGVGLTNPAARAVIRGGWRLSPSAPRGPLSVARADVPNSGLRVPLTQPLPRVLGPLKAQPQ